MLFGGKMSEKKYPRKKSFPETETKKLTTRKREKEGRKKKEDTFSDFIKIEREELL